MKRFEKNIDDRKVLVARLSELTGLDARYTRMPRCAYEIGAFTVEKDGSLTVEDGADESILHTLLGEGLILGATEPDAEPESRETDPDTAETEAEDADTNPMETETDTELSQTDADPMETDTVPDEADAESETDEDIIEETDQEEAEATVEAQETAGEETTEADAPETVAAQEDNEPAELTISLPLTGHSVGSLRRLINLVYSRGPLLSKATGGTFGVHKDLLAALDEANPVRMEDLIAKERELGGLDGITIDEEKVSFTGFPMTEDAEKTMVFMQLASYMNKHAIEMKRIQAKEVETESEKYTFRNWLVRIGMGTAEFKTARAVLLENLSGHTAFRNKAEEEKWKARQKAKRDEQKAERVAERAAETETAADDATEGSPAASEESA